jgi:hypothetical protein
MHGRNGRAYRLPELPLLIVDGFCRETKTVYELFGCYFHGHTCLQYRDISTMVGDTRSEIREDNGPPGTDQKCWLPSRVAEGM